MAGFKTIWIASILAVAAFFSASATASAQDSQAVWQGLVTVMANTSQCSGVGGTGVGDTHVSIYRPRLQSTDHPNTWLSFVFTRGALTLQNTSESTTPRMNGAGNNNSIGINSRARFFNVATGSYNLTITPATITTSTPVITIQGTINNYHNFAGCTITIKGNYAKRD